MHCYLYQDEHEIIFRLVLAPHEEGLSLAGPLPYAEVVKDGEIIAPLGRNASVSGDGELMIEFPFPGPLPMDSEVFVRGPLLSLGSVTLRLPVAVLRRE